jgi:hypothetical protein
MRQNPWIKAAEDAKPTINRPPAVAEMPAWQARMAAEHAVPSQLGA